MRKLVLSAVALVVVASACTDSDDSAASPEEATPPTTLALTRSSGGLTANDDTGFAVREPALIDVLANDTSGDPDNLEIIEVSVPELGEAQVVTYDWPPKVEFVPPPEGDWTQSTFTYTVRDSTGATATALVTVNRPDTTEPVRSGSEFHGVEGIGDMLP